MGVRKYFFLFVIYSSAFWALQNRTLAAVPAKSSGSENRTGALLSNKIQEQWIHGAGAVRGGSADGYMSLFDVRRSASAKVKTERLVLDWGNIIGQPSEKGGYYQVEYQPQSHRLVINLGLTLNSKIEAKKLTEKLSRGLYIKNANLEFDKLAQAHNIVLDLVKDVRVRVASYASVPGRTKENPLQAPARLVIDLIE